MTTPVNETGAGLLGQLGQTAAPTTASMDKDTFLQLLVAQLRYQDPMNPTDSTQFLAQSAQFTALEKMEDVAEQTAQSVAVQMAFGASSLVGRTVMYTGADGAQNTGTVDGVSFTADGPVLDLGDTEIPLSDVASVRTTPPASATTTG